MIFRPGDRVRCIDPCDGTQLVAGVFTIEHCDAEFIYLEGVSGGWLRQRFVLADPPRNDPFILDAIDV